MALTTTTGIRNLNGEIIELVRANPCLYNKRDSKYKHLEHKQTIWESIAVNLNLSVKECKIKWKSLRDRYRREKNADDLPSGPSQKIGSRWKYLSSLDFLGDHMEDRNILSSYCAELCDNEIIWFSDESQIETPPPKTTTKKRKRDVKKEYEAPEAPEPSSSVKYENFFGMLREKFVRLSENEIDDVQLEILQLVNRKINAKRFST